LTKQLQPVRTCVACRQKRPKKDLIRVAKKDGQVSLNLSGQGEGRGAYICPKESCFYAKDTRSKLGRALRIKLTEADWLELQRQFQRLIAKGS